MYNVDMKNPCVLCIVALSVLLFAEPLTAQREYGGAEPQRSDSQMLPHTYMLKYLLDEEGDMLEEEIATLSASVEETSAESEEGALLRFALGALHTYRYIRKEERSDAFRAKELLETSAYRFGDSYLHRVHLGMAHSFIAKIRTIFGVSNLKKMRDLMDSIPREHTDWLLRFLRGTTLVKVGAALPGILNMKEIKEQAVDVGSNDLRYVLREHRSRSVDDFEAENYNTEMMPVPNTIAEQSQKLLQRLE